MLVDDEESMHTAVGNFTNENGNYRKECHVLSYQLSNIMRKKRKKCIVFTCYIHVTIPLPHGILEKLTIFPPSRYSFLRPVIVVLYTLPEQRASSNKTDCSASLFFLYISLVYYFVIIIIWLLGSLQSKLN